MVKIIEINIEEFEKNIYNQYIKLFPEEEQRDFDKIKNACSNGIEKIYKIINEKNLTIGFIMLERINKKYPYYIDYFGIFEEHQNRGYGTLAIKELIKNVILENELCIEIEKENKNDIMTIKRADFYRKLGFKKIESEYLLYNVLYTPYIYDINVHLDKSKVDKIMFDYYIVNCGKEEVSKNCKQIK